MQYQLMPKFRGAVHILPPLLTEESVIENAFTINEFLSGFARYIGSESSLAANEILMKRKVRIEDGRKIIKTRRDGRKPDFLHEGQIKLSIMADYEAGLIDLDTLKKTLTIADIHDIGEDFAIMPDPLAKFFEKTMDPASVGEPEIEYIVLCMERMTFDRKFTANDMRKTLHLRDSVEIDDEVLKIFLEHLKNNDASVRGYLPPLQILPTPIRKADGQDHWIVSRHIVDGILDWGSYSEWMSKDPYCVYVKMKDRADGLGTRIGPNFDLKAYSHYLSQSYQTFSIDNLGKRMADRFPHMTEAFLQTDDMLGRLHRIGRLYIQVHPDNNLPGSKGHTIETMPVPDFTPYFGNGSLKGYDLMPYATNPLNIILMRIESDPGLKGKGGDLKNKILQGMELAELSLGKKQQPLANQLDLFEPAM